MTLKSYPLKLTTPIRRYGLGGRLIPRVLRKRGLPDGVIAETWEFSDEDVEQVRITNGPLAGRPLREMVEREPEWLVGDGWDGKRFPLHGKFVDASHPVPVQLFVDDAAGAWHILWCGDEPNASMLAGIKPGTRSDELIDAFLKQNHQRVMQQRRIQPGDTVYLPSGTLHSFGPQTLAFTIQPTAGIASDVMPIDIYGTPCDRETRDRCIAATLRQVQREQRPTPTHGLERFVGHNRCTVCTAGPHFVLERWKLTEPLSLTLPAGRFATITNLVEPVGILWDGGTDLLARAESRILPAAMRSCTLLPDGLSYVLISYVPDLMPEIVAPLHDAGYTEDQIRILGDLSSVLTG